MLSEESSCRRVATQYLCTVLVASLILYRVYSVESNTPLILVNLITTQTRIPPNAPRIPPESPPNPRRIPCEYPPNWCPPNVSPEICRNFLMGFWLRGASGAAFSQQRSCSTIADTLGEGSGLNKKLQTHKQERGKQKIRRRQRRRRGERRRGGMRVRTATSSKLKRGHRTGERRNAGGRVR